MGPTSVLYVFFGFLVTRKYSSIPACFLELFLNLGKIIPLMESRYFLHSMTSNPKGGIKLGFTPHDIPWWSVLGPK